MLKGDFIVDFTGVTAFGPTMSYLYSSLKDVPGRIRLVDPSVPWLLLLLHYFLDVHNSDKCMM